MAVPSYTTDLTLIHTTDAFSANWTEPTGFADGAITLPETDYFIQNTGCLSKTMGNPTTASSGAIYNNGSGITVTAPNAVFIWIYFGAPNALSTQANGGLRFFAGSGTAAFKQYYVKGSDTYTYGGWVNMPFHPSIETGAATISVNATNGTYTRSAGDFTTNGFEAGMTIIATGFTNAGNNATKIISTVTATVITVTSNTGLVTETGGGDEQIRQCDNLTGAPTTTAQYFGAAAVLSGASAVSKGNPLGIDVLRYGRGEARIADGSTADGYATFGGFAATNDSLSNRWGLIQAVDGGYLVKGLVIFGYSTAVDFRDSNTSILIDDTEKTVSSFNAFEVRQALSRVDLTNISFLALGTTARGNFITTNNADINITGCTFTSMGTFGFQSGSTILTSTFRQCDLVTQTGATFTGCTFDSSRASASILSDNPSVISGCTFISDGSNHAIQISAAGSFNLTDHTFTGYATTDGSTGNEVIYNNSGGAVTLNSSGNTGTISIRNGAGASTTIVQSVTVSMHVENSAGTDIQNAQVYIQKSASGKSWNYTSASANNAGDADFIIIGAVDADLPQGGWLHVWDASTNLKQNYRYLSWTTSTDTTFTLRNQVTGSATSVGTSTILNSTGIGALDIQEGDTIRNTTDGSWAIVDELSTNSATTTDLTGGSDNTWQNSDAFSVHRLAVNYTVTEDLIDIPIFNGQTDSNGDISTTYNYGALSTPLSVIIRVRLNQGTPKYIPFNTSGTIGSSGFSGTAVLSEDTVAT